MTTIFSKIINREIPGDFIYEDDICVVIMDAFPFVEGQSLVILKREVDYLFDVTKEEYQHLMEITRKMVKATDIALKTKRTCIVIEGFEVPHVHIKLFPIAKNSTDTLMSIAQERIETTPEEIATQAEKIKAAL